MKRTAPLAAMAVAICLPCGAQAASFDLNSIKSLNQGQFQQLAQDLGAALSYKPLAPADSLGPLGWDVGVATSGTSLANTAAVQAALSSGTVFSTLPVPTLRLLKGLPNDVDIGVMYGQVPSSSIKLYGAQAKWAVLPGDTTRPAVALRGAITRIDGVGLLGFETYSLDLSVSQSFLLAQPYAGLGLVRSRSATDGLALQQVNLTQGKVFGGADFNFGLAHLDVELDSTGGILSYGAKISLRF